MNESNFNEFLLELSEATDRTMFAKNNGQYAKGSEDKLHNFHAGAEINGSTPAQACWGYLTKHLTALRDKVQRNDFSDRDDLKEKCMDSINYIRFIWLLGNEEIEKQRGVEKVSKNDTYSPVFYEED